VMVYVSFIEIFLKSHGAFQDSGKSERDAYLSATLCFFAGMLLLRLLAVLVHMIDKDHDMCVCCDGDAIDQARESYEATGTLGASAEDANAEGSGAAAAAAEGQPAQNQQEAGSKAPADQAEQREKRDAKQLQMMGVNTAIAIGLHNFPEGLATFVATLAEPTVGVTLAVAIGIHNIPEGLCVALPIYYATGSRLKGFLWALLSGISEPIGALIGYGIIKATGDDMNQLVYGVLFGVVAGMMVMIVILELLPTAYKYDPKDRFVTNSVAAGMVVMAASLCLFQI